MKKIALATIVAACFVVEMNAQKWKPGIVVLAMGDTLKGQLSVAAMSSLECQFMTADGSATKYTPDRVTSFYIPGEAYIERATIKNNDQEQEVFMNVLVLGRAKLLERRGVYYLRDEDNHVSLLESVKQVRTIEGRDYFTIRELYKDVLREKLTDCAEAEGSITSTSLTRRSLTGLITTYNSCFSSTPEIISKTKVARSYLSLGAQYIFLTTKIDKFPTGYGHAATGSDFQKQHKQSIPGFYLHYTLGARNRLGLQLSFYNTSYQFNSHTTYSAGVKKPDGTYRAIQVDYKYTLQYNTTVVPMVVKFYLFNSRIIQPVTGLGLGLQINNGFEGTEDYSNFTDDIHSSKKIGSVKHIGMSVIYCLGVNVNAGPVRIGGVANFEVLRSPLTFDGQSRTFTASQLNAAVTLSVGYAFVR